MDTDQQGALLAELGRVKRALGMALAELCRINAGCPSDANMEIWEAFDNMGGDGDALFRSIEFIREMKQTASTSKASAGGAR